MGYKAYFSKLNTIIFNALASELEFTNQGLEKCFQSGSTYTKYPAKSYAFKEHGKGYIFLFGVLCLSNNLLLFRYDKMIPLEISTITPQAIIIISSRKIFAIKIYFVNSLTKLSFQFLNSCTFINHNPDAPFLLIRF